MYIGNSYSTWQKHPQESEFRCPNCRHQQKMIVTGLGMGKAASPYFLNEQNAPNQAYERAGKAAIKNAAETARLVRCPSCHTRNGKAITKFWLIQFLKIFGGGLLFLLLAGLIYSMERDEMIYYIFFFAWLVYIPIIFFLDIKWRWFTVDQRTEFLPNAYSEKGHERQHH